MLHFLHPWLLLGIVPIAVSFIFMNRQPPISRKIFYPFAKKGLENLVGTSLVTRIPLYLRILIFLLLLIALARPQTSSTFTKRNSEGIDIMITFDVSKSMLIEDQANHQSRIEMAKETMKDFVHQRRDDRIGFLMFAGESLTLCPPTLDYEVLEAAIDAANTNQLKDGTAIGDALASAVNRIKDSNAKSKIIVLITDGDNNMGSIAPLTAGSLAKGYGIKIYSVALGREGLVDMPQIVSFFGQEHKEYQRVMSTINPELIKKIAEETGGKFFRAAEEGSLRRILREIDKLERNKVENKQRIQWEEHFHIPLLGALIMLCLDFVLARTRFRILPN